MGDFEILRDLLREDALAPVFRTPTSGNRIALTEEGDQEYTLNVTGAPDGTIAFRTDRFPPPKRVFRNKRQECKRADYVVIASGKRNVWVVYIEMKRRKGARRDIERQLRGAKCVVSYCRAIVREFWCDCSFLSGRHERFVTVGYISVNKNRTRKRKGFVHDNPNAMLKLSAPDGTVPFQRLIHGR